MLARNLPRRHHTTMRIPNPADIDSEFQVLDDEYEQPEFYGGAFEGSHAFADVVVLRLYSIVPDENEGTDLLRVETRHHASGRVMDHKRTEYDLDADRTVEETGQPLMEFCRDHHYDDPHSEVVSLVETVEQRRA